MLDYDCCTSFLRLQVCSLLSGSDGSVLSIKVKETSLKSRNGQRYKIFKQMLLHTSSSLTILQSYFCNCSILTGTSQQSAQHTEFYINYRSKARPKISHYNHICYLLRKVSLDIVLIKVDASLTFMQTSQHFPPHLQDLQFFQQDKVQLLLNNCLAFSHFGIKSRVYG